MAKKQKREVKRKGRAPKEKKQVEFKDSLSDVTEIETVELKDIDLEDRSFQYRLRERLNDIKPSLETEGQLVPVTLWGESPPYKIIDGYRRISAVKEIGWSSVKAMVKKDITEDDAYRLSFVENVKRKSFSPMEMANAVWKAKERGKTNEELESEFGLSKRQIQRYKSMMEFSKSIKDALSDEKISMAHAFVLHTMSIEDIDPWIERVKKDDLSAQALKRAVTKELGPKSKPRKFIQKKKDGFRLYPIRLSENTSDKDREKIIKVLEDALAIAKGKKK